MRVSASRRAFLRAASLICSPRFPARPRRLLDWLCAGRADYRAHQIRREQVGYLARKRLCKNVWIGAGLLMLLNPLPGIVIGLALLATFISFSILDEGRS